MNDFLWIYNKNLQYLIFDIRDHLLLLFLKYNSSVLFDIKIINLKLISKWIEIIIFLRQKNRTTFVSREKFIKKPCTNKGYIKVLINLIDDFN